MVEKIKPYIGLLLSIGLFAAAGWLMHRELAVYRFEEVAAAFRSIPLHLRLLSFFLALLSYILMTGYDTLALMYIRHELPYRKIALASFTGYAFSNNTGLSMIAGASVRYRLYSVWGLSSLEIAKVVGFCALSLWMGFFLLNGAVFLGNPEFIGQAVHLPLMPVRFLGACLLGVVAVYISLSFSGKESFTFRQWEIAVPSPKVTVSQIALGVLDWTLAGLVLYVLLSHFAALSLPGFLSVYLAVQLAAMFSQVPGGLGIFETLMVMSLSSRIPAPDILGALIAFRVIYYWTPLCIAALLLGVQEAVRGKEKAAGMLKLFDRWVSPVIPSVFGIAVFIAGAVLLFSGATPAIGNRLSGLKQLLALPFLEFSHFMGSVAGMGLLILGRGLQRRLDAAYVLSVILLVSGILASLAKGFDYEEAMVLTLILAALIPSRRHFYRRASLFRQRFNLGWTLAVLSVLGSSVWIGFYAYRHVEYADSLWWQFTFSGNAARFLRATMGASMLGLFFGLARLMSAAPPVPKFPDKGELLESVVPVVAKSLDTTANLALLGDKMILMNEGKTAFIMYGIEGKSWISMGDPVGPGEEWADLIWRFRELADRSGGWPVFYEVGHEKLHLYPDAGFSLVKLGEEAKVDLFGFSLEGSSRKGLRGSRNKVEKLGCVFRVIPASDVASRINDLKEVSDSWLKDKDSREKGFSLGFFDPDYLSLNSVAVVEQEGRIVAFANMWQGSESHELTVDLMRFHPDAPGGIMDYLFIEVMLWGKAGGFKWFNLGMAPLSGLEKRSRAPLWSKLGALVYQYGEDFYNFKGLRHYKEKFDPVWTPRYLASPGGFALPVIFANLTALISRGMKNAPRK
jgi:phosphatidylglycerol lysyltransferase